VEVISKISTYPGEAHLQNPLLLIEEELAYDIDNLLDESETFLRKLNTAQRHAFNVIVSTVNMRLSSPMLLFSISLPI
jgi:hypothetical protein